MSAILQLLNISERVTEGIRLLDRLGPKDWREKATGPGPFRGEHMISMNKCVLGRVYGHFVLGLQSRAGVMLNGHTSVYGFNSTGDIPNELALLAAEWNKALDIS